jgi:hydrogenase assembly chaperone HypC/HupF
MSDEQQEPVGAAYPQGSLLPDALKHELTLVRDASCGLDPDGHCVTCSDEALPAKVMRVDSDVGLALVTIKDTTKEIDITLVDDVAPGDLLLVHGGVAIAIVERHSSNDAGASNLRSGGMQGST